MFYTDQFMQDVMGIESLPTTLYHYTSIETLALILAKASLRFTRLDGVNDPEEARAADIKDAATLVFASCWTAVERESIAMWRMYTPGMRGVRIRLPNNPFDGRDPPVIYEKGGAFQTLASEIEIRIGHGAHWIRTRSIVGPNKIYYTDDPQYRNGRCIATEGDLRSVQLYDLGMVKGTDWAFEEEWRYRVLAVASEQKIRAEMLDLHPVMTLSTNPVDQRALYVPLARECLDGIDVLLGPCATEGEELIARSLLKAYAPGGTVRRSEIKIRPIGWS